MHGHWNIPSLYDGSRRTSVRPRMQTVSRGTRPKCSHVTQFGFLASSRNEPRLLAILVSGFQ